jgi:hypothetical protein
MQAPVILLYCCTASLTIDLDLQAMDCDMPEVDAISLLM